MNYEWYGGWRWPTLVNDWMIAAQSMPALVFHSIRVQWHAWLIVRALQRREAGKEGATLTWYFAPPTLWFLLLIAPMTSKNRFTAVPFQLAEKKVPFFLCLCLCACEKRCENFFFIIIKNILWLYFFPSCVHILACENIHLQIYVFLTFWPAWLRM